MGRLSDSGIIYQYLTVREIKDALGWEDQMTPAILCNAVMLLCDHVQDLERRLSVVETAKT